MTSLFCFLRDGFEFVGWFNTNAATGGVQITSDTIVPAGSPAYWARWVRTHWTITFDGNSGAPVTTTQLAEIGSTIGNLPEDPTRAGFAFVGWFDTNAETGGTQITADTITPNSNVRYWARWSRYTILTFNGNGGTPFTQRMDIQPGNPIGTLPEEPTRNGYFFVGWFTSATQGTQATANTVVPTTNVTYWARWSRDITLTFDGNGGFPAAIRRTIQPGDAIGTLIPEGPTREGYDFVGWFDTPGETGGTQITADTIPSTSTTYWARWEAAEPGDVTLTFIHHDGRITVMTVPAGTPVYDIPEELEREGYDFEGWFAVVQGAEGQIAAFSNDLPFIAGSLSPNVDTTFESRWFSWPWQVTMTFMDDQVTMHATIVHRWPGIALLGGRRIGNALPPAPEANNSFTFIGWFDESGAQVTADTLIPEEDTVYTARWEATLTFFGNGGSPALTRQTVQLGEMIGSGLPEAPTRDEYTFAGWFDTNAQTGGNQLTPSSIAASESISFWARWTSSVSAAITFDHNDGTSETTILNRPVGSPIGELPESPTRDDYTFVGWYTVNLADVVNAGGFYHDQDGGERVTADTIIPDTGEPVTFYARWSVVNRTYADWYRDLGIAWPLDDLAMNYVSSRFGPRTPYHLGLDIVGESAGVIAGTPVIAVVSGEVVDISWNEDIRGYTISIESNITDPATGDPLTFIYMHLQHPPRRGGGEGVDDNLLEEGNTVRVGEVIGNVGDTGTPGQIHLHFEVSNNLDVFTAENLTSIRNRINPMFFFSKGTFSPRTDLGVPREMVWNEMPE